MKQEDAVVGKIKVELYRSPVGFPEKQRETVIGLGLRKIRQVRELDDSKAIRGMVIKIPHLVRIIQ